MRNRIFVGIIVILATFSGLANAQTPASDTALKLTLVSAGAGESPISSGISMTADFESESGRFVEVTAQSDQAWFQVGRKLRRGRLTATAAGTIGHFSGAFYVGPYLNAEVPLWSMAGKEVKVSATEWPAYFLGREPKPWRSEVDGRPENRATIKAGYFTFVEVKWNGLGLNFTHLAFLDDPVNILPGVSYSHKLTDEVEVNGSVLWNRNQKRAMYFIGATWRPKK